MTYLISILVDQVTIGSTLVDRVTIGSTLVLVLVIYW